MQHRVARRLPRVLTVSHASRTAIADRMAVTADVVPLGVDHRIFRPRPEIAKVPGRIVTTASADEPLKGLAYLIEAAGLLRGRVKTRIVAIGIGPERQRLEALARDVGVDVDFRNKVPGAELPSHFTARPSPAPGSA